MKKTYFKPQVQSEDMFEQTANATGFNQVNDLSCTRGYDSETICDLSIIEVPLGEIGGLCEVAVIEKS